MTMPMPDSLKQKTFTGVSWSLVEQVLARGVNFIIGIILARLLSPTDYGLVGMLGIFLGISQIFIDGGLASALIQRKSPSDKDFSTVYIINMSMSIVLFAVLFFIAPYVAGFYDQPLMKPLLRVLAISLIIGSLSSVQSTLLSIRVDFKSKTYISILSSIISGSVGILCAYRGMGVWALVAQTIASSAALTVLTLLYVRWMPRLVFSKESFKNLFSFSSKVLAASLISTVYDNAYPMVIGKKFSAADVGQYTRAGQFPGIANGTITGALGKVAFPVFSKIQDDDERLITAYEKYIQISAFILFPILMGICGCAKPLVSFLLTDKWLECVPLMQILCFGIITNGITTINLNLLYVKGRSDYVLKLEIIKKSIAFSILFISMFFSVKIMCYGQVLYGFVSMYLNTYYTKKLLGYSFGKQIKVVYPYFLIALVVLFEALLFSSIIKNSLISLAVSLMVCPISYLLLSRYANLYAYKEVLDLFYNYFGILKGR